MKLMQPIASSEVPIGDEWVYEVKYDGFRCVLHWDIDGKIRLTSRNNKDLTGNFPEVIDFCQKHQALFQPHLPLMFDGEIAILNTPYQANFAWIQKRGRLKSMDSIEKAAEKRPACYLAFDLLQVNDKQLTKETFQQRKQKLKNLFSTVNLHHDFADRLQYVPSYNNPNELWEIIFTYKGEGLIAKRKKSNYVEGKAHNDWFKIKNWRIMKGIVTAFDTKNDYFAIQVYQEDTLIPLGKCKHGLDDETAATLKQLFSSKGDRLGDEYVLPPAICAEIHTLDFLKGELREPEFEQILPNTSASDCTMENIKLDMAMLPKDLELTNTTKTFWPEPQLTKGDLLTYLRDVSPYMLPFLKDRVLTLIRCPDGVNGESFFQKHLPDYAPSSIRSLEVDQEKLIICDDLESLMWFGNHGAVEYHVPFQKVNNQNPAEIVFDLDPPDRDRFPLAIKAALLIKELLDGMELLSFVKTSGSKGLQIHIPLPKDSMTYDDTAIFTQAIAFTIEQGYPKHFTTERLKKNRHDRMYIDYIQHGKDKTIITPYSPRKKAEATIATPLFWEEVKEGLTPVQFTIDNVIDRIQEQGCPFAGYFAAGRMQKLDKMLGLVRKP